MSTPCSARRPTCSAIVARLRSTRADSVVSSAPAADSPVTRATRISAGTARRSAAASAASRSASNDGSSSRSLLAHGPVSPRAASASTDSRSTVGRGSAIPACLARKAARPKRRVTISSLTVAVTLASVSGDDGSGALAAAMTEGVGAEAAGFAVAAAVAGGARTTARRAAPRRCLPQTAPSPGVRCFSAGAGSGASPSRGWPGTAVGFGLTSVA